MTDSDITLSKAAILDALIQMPIFDALDTDELKTAVGYMNLITPQKGEIIFREGDRGDYVCFVAEGTLDVIKTSDAGHYVVLSSLSRGRSIGEMSILDNYPRSATVRARTRAVLITLSRESFEDIVNDYPRIGVKIVRGVARMLSLAMRKTSSRLADYMLPLG
jgi:CRP-like cAMP-binding protein